MARDTVRYGYTSEGFVHMFGDVEPRRQRDLSKLYDMLDNIDRWFGMGVLEKEMSQQRGGQVIVTLKLDGDMVMARDDRADRLERMVQWMALRMSKSELQSWGVIPVSATDDFTAEQVIAGLCEMFAEFEEADARLRGTRRK